MNQRISDLTRRMRLTAANDAHRVLEHFRVVESLRACKRMVLANPMFMIMTIDHIELRIAAHEAEFNRRNVYRLEIVQREKAEMQALCS